MTDQTFEVTDIVKGGILDITAHANVKLGNSAGADFFIFPNDGNTFLAVSAGASVKVITYTAVLNEWGRTESTTFSPTASKFSLAGPFPPHLFNQSDGTVKFKPATSGHVDDQYLVVRIP